MILYIFLIFKIIIIVFDTYLFEIRKKLIFRLKLYLCDFSGIFMDKIFYKFFLNKRVRF